MDDKEFLNRLEDEIRSALDRIDMIERRYPKITNQDESQYFRGNANALTSILNAIHSHRNNSSKTNPVETTIKVTIEKSRFNDIF